MEHLINAIDPFPLDNIIILHYREIHNIQYIQNFARRIVQIAGLHKMRRAREWNDRERAAKIKKSLSALSLGWNSPHAHHQFNPLVG